MGFRIHEVDEGGDIISGVWIRLLSQFTVFLDGLADVPHNSAEDRTTEKPAAYNDAESDLRDSFLHPLPFAFIIDSSVLG
jgi:hypothetical protein